MHGIREVMKEKNHFITFMCPFSYEYYTTKKRRILYNYTIFFTIHCTKIIGMLDQK